MRAKMRVSQSQPTTDEENQLPPNAHDSRVHTRLAAMFRRPSSRETQLVATDRRTRKGILETQGQEVMIKAALYVGAFAITWIFPLIYQ